MQTITVYGRLGTKMRLPSYRNVFQKLFREHIREKRDFLVVDKVSPFELRKNLFEVIQYDDYDD